MVTDDLIKLDNLALDLCVRSLHEYGNELSAAHEEMLQNAAIVFGFIASGNIPGRYVWSATAGLGKTRLMISWVKAMVALGFPWSVAICAERVEELTTIQAALLEGECPVPKDLIGIWFADRPDAAVPPTFNKRQAAAGAYGTKPILLLTHSRMQRGQEVAQGLRYRGQPRDLVFYDESMLTASFWEAPYWCVSSELRAAIDLMEIGSRAKAILQAILDMLDREKEAQLKGALPTLIKLPEEVTRKSEVRDEIARIVAVYDLKHLDDLLFHQNREADIRLILAKNPRNTILIRTFTAVPIEELDRLVILDASYPIRTLPQLANEHIHPDAKALRVKTFEETWPRIFKGMAGIKHYDHVQIDLMPTLRSGRQYSIDDADMGGDIVKVIASIPEDEPVLVWTFLPHGDNGAAPVDFGRNLRDALVEQLGADAATRVKIETFGQEQATNTYKHIPNVIFQGCLELRPEQLAAQYVAETRDILAPVAWSEIDRINQGEVVHRIYQALHRGRCREAWLDTKGQTQARPMRVWIFNRFHKYLQQELGRVMPGVKFTTWWPEHMGKEALSKEAMGAMIIKGILGNMTTDKISLRAMRKMSPILCGLAKRTFQRARDLALGGDEGGWTMKGSSLVRTALVKERSSAAWTS